MTQDCKLSKNRPLVDISRSKKDLLKSAHLFAAVAFDEALEQYQETENEDLKSIIGFLGVALVHLDGAGIDTEMICTDCANASCEQWWREYGGCNCEITH